jgi:hypothetical protein
MLMPSSYYPLLPLKQWNFARACLRPTLSQFLLDLTGIDLHSEILAITESTAIIGLLV